MASFTYENSVHAFIESLATEKGFSAHTCRAYQHDLEEFFGFLKMNPELQKAPAAASESVDPLQVDGLMIRGYLGYLYQKNSKTTVARKLSAIRSFYKSLVRRGVLEINPAEMIHTPKQDKAIPTYLPVDEMFRLLDSIQTDTLLGLRNRAIFETLYSCGLRVSELAGMNTSNVIFQQHTCGFRVKEAKIGLSRSAKKL